MIHDVACDERTEPHDEVHRAFYYAMRADGVGWLKANTLYQAVKQFGPTWNIDTGTAMPVRSPGVAEMESFLEAVKQAAEEIGEGGDPEEVERRTDQILRSTPESSSPQRRKAKKAPLHQRSLNRLTPLKSAGLKERKESAHEIRLFAKAPAASRSQLAETVDLPSFRTTTHGLSKQERLLLVEQAQVLIEQNYVHLPLKEAMHAVEPLQRLRLLHRGVEQTPDEDLEDALRFHHELAAIFLSLRDLHTNYLLPDPIANKIAFVPFIVEDYFEEEETDGPRRYLVTRLFNGFQEPPHRGGY